MIALDEPTNYLDNETLAALTKALKEFKGGVVTVSHNAAFVNELCKENWTVAGGMISISGGAETMKRQAVVARERARRRNRFEERRNEDFVMLNFLFCKPFS